MNAAALIVRWVPPAMFARAAAWQHHSSWGKSVSRLIARRLNVRTGFVRSGFAAGLEFDCGESVLSYLAGTAEPCVQEVLARLLKPGDTVFDVGANVGFFTMGMARLVGPTGRVIALEPSPRSAATLRRNAELNGFEHVQVLELAASDAARDADLIVDRGSTVAHLAVAASPEQPAVRVRTTSIDEVARSRPGPGLIKMDIEGAEVDALVGAKETLETFQPLVVCELHDTRDRVLEILDSVNYGAMCVEEPASPAAGWDWNAHIVAFPRSREGEVRAVLMGSAADGQSAAKGLSTI